MNVLVVTIEGGGNMPPVLNLIRQLVDRGHRVTVMCEPCQKESVGRTGATSILFREYFTRTDRNVDISEDWKSKNNFFENVIFGPAQVVVRETLENIKSCKADLLIVDVLLLPGLIAGEAAGIPRVALFHFPEYLPGPNRPPGGLGLAPGRNVIGRIRDRFLGKVFDMVFNKWRGKINTIRKDLHLPAVGNTTDILHKADMRIIQTSRTFDFPILPVPLNVCYSGPVLDDPDWVLPWENPWDDDRPLVVVSLSSTFQNQKKAIGNCIQALGALDVQGLVTLGPAMEAEQFTVPENVKVISNGSHAQIFPHAACVVTHAGHGTVMRALSNHVPLVCLPMGRDQDDNAARVVHHKAGIGLSPRAGARRIRQAVSKILQDNSYKENARRLGEKIIADAGSGDIISELERLAGVKSGVTGPKTKSGAGVE